MQKLNTSMKKMLRLCIKNSEYIELYFSLILAVSQAKVIIKTLLYFEHQGRHWKWISQYR